MFPDEVKNYLIQMFMNKLVNGTNFVPSGVPVHGAVIMQIGAQASNLFKHRNWTTPNTAFGTSSFGTITDLQSAEGAGPRSVQLTARFIF